MCRGQKKTCRVGCLLPYGLFNLDLHSLSPGQPLNLWFWTQSTSLWSFDWAMAPLYSVCIGRPVLAFCWFCVLGVFLVVVCFTTVLWWLTLSCSSVPMLSFSLVWRILPRIFCRVGLVRNSFSLLLFCLFYFVESLSFSLK